MEGFWGLILGWKGPETSLSLLTMSSVEAPIPRALVGGVFALPRWPIVLRSPRESQAFGLSWRHPALGPHLSQSLLQAALGSVLEVYLSLPHLAPPEPCDHMPNHMTVSLVRRGPLDKSDCPMGLEEAAAWTGLGLRELGPCLGLSGGLGVSYPSSQRARQE